MNTLILAALPLLLISLPSAFAASLPPKAISSVKYTVTDIGTLGGNESSARALNEAGDVVGSSLLAVPMAPGQKTYIHAFLWKKGKLEQLDKGDNTPVSGALDINNQGECVGLNGKACLWKGGHVQSLGTLDIHFSRAFSMANGINDKGQVCGLSDAPNSSHAFLWQKGKMIDLTPGKGERSNAMCINGQGQMVGWTVNLFDKDQAHQDQAVFWSHGKTTMLGYLPGGKFSEAYGVNDAGQVVGAADDSSGKVQAFLWTAKQGMVRLAVPANDNSRAIGINRQGLIAGSYDLAPHVLHACLWQQGICKDLNALIAPHSGWVLITASAINNRGQIVGTGRINGQKRAFLLTPKPQPKPTRR